MIAPTATSLFKILLKYRPEDKAEKKDRLLKRAQTESEGKTVETKKPINVKYGLNHVTYLIEQHCVGKWKFHTVLLRARLALELLSIRKLQLFCA
ncbi:hypothetical protein RYX36_011022 [Vicia faba]